MQGSDHSIRYMIGSMALDRVVTVEVQQRDITVYTFSRPWLTVCMEPVSGLLLASRLDLDPPEPAIIKALLYQIVAPSKEYPFGRRPDEIWVDGAAVFGSPRVQALLQRLCITPSRSPSWGRGRLERVFGSFSFYLQSSCSVLAPNSGGQPLATSLSRVEEDWRQWVETYSCAVQGQQGYSFLDVCRMRWQTSPVTVRELDILLNEFSTS